MYENQGWIKKRNFKQSEEAKLKNSEAHLGRTRTEETKNKAHQTILAKYGSYFNMYKITQGPKTQEQKNKISLKLKEYNKTHKQVNTGKIAIYNPKTLKTKYIEKEKIKNYLNLGYKKGVAPTNNRIKQSKKVICISTGEIFESAAVVAKLLGVKDMSLTCKNFKTKGKYNKAKGKEWAYLEDWIELSK